MTDNTTTLPLSRQTTWLRDYRPALHLSERGKVIAVGDGIAWIEGLPSAAMDEMLNFQDGSHGIVFDLQPERAGITLLHQSETLTAGTEVYGSHQLLSIPVGDAMLGRVIDPLGNPLDGLPPPDCHQFWRLDTPSPPIIKRDFVQRPFYSGNKIIDTMLPLGRGQRQLIIGDAGLGKSALALDIITNQHDQKVRCIYVLIGQKRSTVINTIETLRDHGALDFTTMVVGEANSLPGLKYLAPYSGCSLAEYWMAQGHDTLVIYDDLSTHARTYRELSLLLRRPPGREAYPGDIFYIHSRLLERSTCLSAQFGGGSMTALPLIQTQQGEIASYIPTNLISITDGQIYLDQHLFSAGVRPAIDVSKSVSRIGGRAQHPSIRAEAGRMKLDYQQFLELEIFTRFGARLESFMERAIQRGRVLRELLKQERFSPLTIQQQLAWLIAYNEGLMDQIPTDRVAKIVATLSTYIGQTDLELDDPHLTWLKHIRNALHSSGEETDDITS